MEKSKAELYYERHQERVRKYNLANREKMRERSLEYFKRIKADPEKYAHYLKLKRQRYKDKYVTPALPVIQEN